MDFKLIVQGCLKEDRLSQKSLYEFFYGYGMSVCLRYSKDKAEAKEILNNGFLSVFAKLDYYDMEMPFKPWLRRILINAAIDYHRKKKRKPFLEEIQEHNEVVAGNTIDAIKALEYQDLLRKIQQLPNQYRLVFNLYAIEGFKHQEIAERLNISVGTSKSNLSRARVILQKRILEENK